MAGILQRLLCATRSEYTWHLALTRSPQALTLLILVAVFVYGTFMTGIYRQIAKLAGPRSAAYALVTGTLEMIPFMPFKIILIR